MSTTGTAYHHGLTPTAIIDAAVKASRGEGLESWSLRDLAKRLHVTPPTIYHHVGGQELLRRHVVERVLEAVTFPTETMPWRQWFRAALFPARLKPVRRLVRKCKKADSGMPISSPRLLIQYSKFLPAQAFGAGFLPEKCPCRRFHFLFFNDAGAWQCHFRAAIVFVKQACFFRG